MIATVYPGDPKGEIQAIPSKSHVHRLLICAALADGITTIECPVLNEDIEATARCLRALGANISYDDGVFTVSAGETRRNAELDVGESGSTYRFLFPVAAALNAYPIFRLHGRLPQRPMDALVSSMERHGAAFTGLGSDSVIVTGRLNGGTYELPGNVSSQYISALIFALPLTGEDSRIVLTTAVESTGYINMTIDAVRAFGITVIFEGDSIIIPGGQKYTSSGHIRAEGDWSNAAFMLCMAAACGADIRVTGLDNASPQGDRTVNDIIRKFGTPPVGQNVSIADIPDLAPALAVIAASAKGQTRLTDAARLRLKESDRITAITSTLRALGADAAGTDDSIIINGGMRMKGGRIDSCGDHRIVMMAACCAAVSDGPVIIDRAEAVRKSYPRFFDDIQRIGLRVELK